MNGFYPERMSIVYTRYKRQGDFDVLSSTVRDLKMAQQETRKLDGQCVDFCGILKDRCFFVCLFFFHRQTVYQNLSDGMFRRTTEGKQLGLFLLTVFGDFFLSLLHCLSICLYCLHNVKND